MRNGKQELIAIMEAADKIVKARRNFELNMAFLNLLHPIGEEDSYDLLV